MKRIAILIGSPSSLKTPEAGKYLAGVEIDIENMHRFLTSSIGGCWQENEIKLFFPNPTYAEVEPMFNLCENADFAFVYFSGHGGTDMKNNEPRVQFSYNDNPLVRNIANRAKRQITIIDACRGYSDYFDFTGEGIKYGKITFPNINSEYAKQLFIKYISQIPEERRVLFFASQHNQNAQDSSFSGGLFSSNLLNTAKRITENTNNPIINVEQVFQETYKLIQKYHQPDLILNVKDAQLLPFTVNPVFNNQLINTQINNPKIFEDFFKGFLIGSAIVGISYIISSILTGKK